MWETSACLILTGISFTCESISNTHLNFWNTDDDCYDNDCLINQLADSPTRIRIGQRPNILDLVLSNINDHISNVNVGSVVGRSDHSTITFNFNLHPITEDGKFKRYIYDKGNYKETNKYLKQDINIYTSDDTDCIWKAIKTNIMKGMEDFIPTIDLHCMVTWSHYD